MSRRFSKVNKRKSTKYRKRKSTYKKRKNKRSKRKTRKISRKRSSAKGLEFGAMYGDPMFGHVLAKNIKANLYPYYEYNVKTFPSPGGIRKEVGTGYKNVPISMGKVLPPPFYPVYNT